MAVHFSKMEATMIGTMPSPNFSCEILNMLIAKCEESPIKLLKLESRNEAMTDTHSHSITYAIILHTKYKLLF